jgi:hypothetical protein
MTAAAPHDHAVERFTTEFTEGTENNGWVFRTAMRRARVIGIAIDVHRPLGSGLLESA